MIERQVEQLVTQAEQLGKLKAENQALRTVKPVRTPVARRKGSKGHEATREPSAAGVAR
jgi:hypothetical protein